MIFYRSIYRLNNIFLHVESEKCYVKRNTCYIKSTSCLKVITLYKKMEFKCNYCEISFKRNCDLVRHSLTIKCKEKRDAFNINIKSKTVISKLEEELKLYKINKLEYSDKIKLLELEISKITQENILLKGENKALEKSNESFRNIVEKAATKTTIKNNNNYSHNNYLNHISTEPIKMSEILKQIKQFVNCKTVMYDDNDFHDHIVDNILKDKNGKDKVLCTDINRKNFTYKDEISGELISDPELERLREQFKKGSDIREIRRELLEKLVIEYEDNGSVGIDPYKRFSEIIQKLNFGTPFVDHVAKKTYVKRCSSFKTENVSEINPFHHFIHSVGQGDPTGTEDINKILSVINPLEDILYNEQVDNSEEEEYKKLLEEFGNEPQSGESFDECE